MNGIARMPTSSSRELAARLRTHRDELLTTGAVVTQLRADLADAADRLDPPPTPICECPGYEHVKGPYPSGICRDCGRWYPPKSKETMAPSSARGSA